MIAKQPLALTSNLEAFDVHLNVESFQVARQSQGLLCDHDRGFAAEVFLNVLAIHGNLAGALLQEHACDAGFATAGAIVPITNHLGLRSEEHTSELQSLRHLVCRLLLEK